MSEVTSGPEPVERDSRGILDPWLLRQRVRLTRYPVASALTGLIAHFWAVQWDLPSGTVHRQRVLTRPGANLSVGHPDADSESTAGPIETELHGVATDVSTRALAGSGWAVAALTTPGGLGAFTTEAASAFTDRTVALGPAIGADEADLLQQMGEERDEAARVGLLAQVLEHSVDPQRASHAREVAEVARLAETDRSLRTLSDLCHHCGIGPRTLQRMFLRYAGASPTWVLRRYRLLDVAEAVRDGQRVSWAQVATDLGYADQAHLTRDFRATIGQTPTAYAAAQPSR
jgi:AraC-like DNA-binding protein